MLVKIINNVFDERIGLNPEQYADDLVQLKLYYGDQKNFPDDLSCFYPFLSDQEFSRSKRLIKKKDERTYVISHALLNKQISELLEMDFDELQINYFNNKKPFVEDKRIDFNLSHSADYFAFVISIHDNMFVGVDIEVIREDLDMKPIIENYYHENEIRYVLQNESKHFLSQHQKFYEVWTRKEAFLKMLGIGLLDSLSEIDMSPGNRELLISDTGSFNLSSFSNTFLYTLRLFDNQVLSLAINYPVNIIPSQYLNY